MGLPLVDGVGPARAPVYPLGSQKVTARWPLALPSTARPARRVRRRDKTADGFEGYEEESKDENGTYSDGAPSDDDLPSHAAGRSAARQGRASSLEPAESLREPPARDLFVGWCGVQERAAGPCVTIIFGAAALSASHLPLPPRCGDEIFDASSLRLDTPNLLS
eukprot:scaffold30186_cov70-Phaeocystis_antarctica.AAC.2